MEILSTSHMYIKGVEPSLEVLCGHPTITTIGLYYIKTTID